MLKTWSRFSYESLFTDKPEDQHGNLMISRAGQVDVSGMTILACTVDTVRPLYQGTLKPDLLERLDAAYQNHENLVAHDGFVFAVGGAMQGGYKYRLQNNDLGLIVLLKHRYHDADKPYQHLKIEASPKLIQSRDPVELQAYFDKVAAYWLDDPKPSGCSVHMAMDIQGWKPSRDFMDRFVCRSRRVSSSSGISEWMVESGDIATVYNQGQSLRFGTASTLQCAIYNKTTEAKFRGKLDFWETIWKRLGGDEPFTSAYKPDQDVWRIEFRLHQSVIREFAQGTLDQTGHYDWLNKKTGELIGTDPALNRFIDVVPHLSGIWKKAAMSFRLDHTKGKLIDPYWQKIAEDALYFDTEQTLEYKRAKKQSCDGLEKNISTAFGHLLSVHAAYNFSLADCIRGLQQSGLWDGLLDYYGRRGVKVWQIKELIKQKLIRRRLLGNAA